MFQGLFVSLVLNLLCFSLPSCFPVWFSVPQSSMSVTPHPHVVCILLSICICLFTASLSVCPFVYSSAFLIVFYLTVCVCLSGSLLLSCSVPVCLPPRSVSLLAWVRANLFKNTTQIPLDEDVPLPQKHFNSLPVLRKRLGCLSEAVPARRHVLGGDGCVPTSGAAPAWSWQGCQSDIYYSVRWNHENVPSVSKLYHYPCMFCLSKGYNHSDNGKLYHLPLHSTLLLVKALFSRSTLTFSFDFPS